MKYIAIIDYGAGNLFGIQQACINADLKPIITNNKKRILEAEGLILPGVGSFGYAMEILSKLELSNTIHKFATSGKKIVGLCLGMQLLLKKSFELGEYNGLNLIPGNIEHISNFINNKIPIKIPHMGWNTIEAKEQFYKDSIFKSLPRSFVVYFAHSYLLKSIDKKYFLTETEYENVKFCSAFKKDNIIGFQFHPENSGPIGVKLLKNIFGGK